MNKTMMLEFFGYQLNMLSMLIFGIIAGLLILFYHIQTTDKLEFADIITKDGKGVSLTKLLQLLGGLTGTWVIIKMAAQGGLSAEIFGVYLTYVASVEGFSKFISAKYNYSETSAKDAKNVADVTNDPQ